MSPIISTLADASSNVIRPWVSPTLSPQPNALVMVFIGNTGSIGDTSSKAASNCNSAFNVVESWKLFQVADPGASSKTSVHVWWAITTSTPGSGSITIDSGSTPAGSSVAVKEVTGVDLIGPIKGLSAPVSGQVTDGTFILNEAPTTDDLVMSVTISRNDFNGANVVADMSFDTNFSYDKPSACMAIQFRTGSLSTTVSYAGLNTLWNSGIAWIVKASSLAPPVSMDFVGFGIPL